MKTIDVQRYWTPEFSLVHPSARPDMWEETRDKWIAAASNQANFEYVVCFDFGRHQVDGERAKPARVVWNYGLHCSVDATNHAAACAVGKVLVVISDDIYPCPNWDRELKTVKRLWGSEECVVRVKTGGTADRRGLMAVQILNRKRYEALGYLFHPSYLSMYADDDFSLHAMADGVVVDTDILMPHHHWTTGERQMDEVYAAQNEKARYEWGHDVLQYRQQQHFVPEMPLGIMEARAAQFHAVPAIEEAA